MASGQLTIIDATGKVVMEVPIVEASSRLQVEVSTLSQGMYFMRLDGATGSRFGKLSKL
jgi:hypothetical protein